MPFQWNQRSYIREKQIRIRSKMYLAKWLTGTRTKEINYWILKLRPESLPMSMCKHRKMTMQWKNTGNSLCHVCRDRCTKPMGVCLLHTNCFVYLHAYSCSKYEVSYLHFRERKPSLCYGYGWGCDTYHLTQRSWFALISHADLSHSNLLWTKCARRPGVLREAHGLGASGT